MHCLPNNSPRAGHTLMELVVAMLASAVLLAGLGSVMLIGNQIAYTPSAAVRRTESAKIANQIAEELRHATLIIQQTPQILEFVVADRDGDSQAERIRYAWSGSPGDPLLRTLNAHSPVAVLEPVHAFSVSLQLTSKTTALKTTLESAEQVLLNNSTVQSGSERDINISSQSAQQINPAAFSSIPANATSWNATKVDFQARQTGANSDTLVVQLRSSGDPKDGPTSQVLGQIIVPEATLTSSLGWNTTIFPSPVRNLALHRQFTLNWSGTTSSLAARLLANDSAAGGVWESNDAGATWQLMSARQLFYRLYGTYTTPGPTYNVTRNYVSRIGLVIQSAALAHGRIDASIPLTEEPELLSACWRADFDADPTIADANGDGTADWALAGGGSFDTTKLINGIWHATGALETRPLHNFHKTTVVEVRCRNTTLGGNGAVVRINADRVGGLYAPLLVYVQRQADGTQTVSLLGKTSDAATTKLFARSRLSGDFVRLRLTILPQYDVVALYINDEYQGAFVYPTYVPSSSNDRFLTFYADTSLAEFDYIDVRVANN